MIKQFAAATILGLICILPSLANSQTKSAGYGSGRLQVQVVPDITVDWWADPTPRKYCTWSIILDWDEDMTVDKYQFRFSNPNSREAKWSRVYKEASNPNVLIGKNPWETGNMAGKWIDHPWGSNWRNVSPRWRKTGFASTVRINHLGDNQKIRVRVRALNEAGKVMYRSGRVTVKLGKAEGEEVTHPHLAAGCYTG